MLEFMYKLLARIDSDEEGQTLIEYALIAALISIVVLAALAAVGTNINTILTEIGNALL